jgi:hypothetical protein
MQDDRRKFPRSLSLKTGKIVSERIPDALDAAVLDLSESGARLLVSDIDEVPDVFDLILDPKGEKVACQVRWKSGYQIGVRFCGSGDPAFKADFFRD